MTEIEGYHSEFGITSIFSFHIFKITYWIYLYARINSMRCFKYFFEMARPIHGAVVTVGFAL
jgi:hypothetical protein